MTAPPGTRRLFEGVSGGQARHTLRRTKQSCVAAARNHAARLAGGKYFLFLDSDDLILPDYIEKCVTVLENNPDCKLVYPLAEYFDAQEGLWNLPDYDGLESLLKGNRIPIISMHRAEDFAALGGFDENLTTHEDWDF